MNNLQDFKQLIEDYGPLLSRVAASYEANDALRQELLQEISLAVWQSLFGFQAKSSVKTYILRVAHNKAVNHVSYYARQPSNQTYCEAEGESHPSPSNTEQATSQEQQIEQLLRQVRKLPLKQRQIITLSMEGLTYEQIADITGLQTSNVGVIISRVRKTLMEVISDEAL